MDATDILKALAERNRLKTIALGGVVNTHTTTRLRELNRTLDTAEYSTLMHLAQSLDNQLDWFNAFQDVQNFMADRGLWDEQDIHANDPAQTLIAGLKRTLPQVTEPVDAAGQLAGDVEMGLGVPVERLRALADEWSARSNREQDAYGLGLSEAASALRRVLGEAHAPAQAQAEPSWVNGQAEAQEVGTLQEALESIGHPNRWQKWTLKAQTTGHRHIGQVTHRLTPKEDLNAALRELLMAESLGFPALPRRWTLESDGVNVEVRGLSRHRVTLTPVAEPVTVPPRTELHRDESCRMELHSDERWDAALRRLERGTPSHISFPLRYAPRWAITQVNGDLISGVYPLNVEQSVEAQLRTFLAGCHLIKANAALSVTLWAVNSTTILADVAVGQGLSASVTLTFA